MSFARSKRLTVLLSAGALAALLVSACEDDGPPPITDNLTGGSGGTGGRAGMAFVSSLSVTSARARMVGLTREPTERSRFEGEIRGYSMVS